MADIFNSKNMYITSDCHFFHNNIVKYCDRNYDWENDDILRMNDDLLAEYDKLPDTEDTVIWNLGDFAYGKSILKDKYSFGRLRDMVARMKGQKRTLCYVLGNHDKDLFKSTKGQTDIKDTTSFFRALGFDYVFNCPIMFRENIIFSHEPVYLKPETGIKNIHGHTHNEPVSEDYFKVDIENYNMKLKAAKADGMKDIPPALMTWPFKEIDTNDYINVCLDANDMKIIDLNDLLKKLS